MTISISTTAFPPFYLNAYVKDQLQEFGILAGVEQLTPIVPTVPTNIEDLFKNYVGAPGVDDPLIITYERLIRFRPTPFYRRKREQIVYYLYSTTWSKVADAHRIIVDALDREDSAAQDIILWMSENIGLNKFPEPINVHFHNIRVYQADETRDILELASAKTVYGNKLIIEYDYHTKDLLGTKYT
jgi:hypothetical protein